MPSVKKKEPKKVENSSNAAGMPPAKAEDPLQSLQLHVNHLRSVAKNSFEAYHVALEGDLARMADIIQEELGGRSTKLTSDELKLIKKMTKRIRQLKVKPDKGRRKDLKRIDDLTDELAVLFEKWQGNY